MNSEGGFGGVKGFDPVFISLGCGPGMDVGPREWVVLCFGFGFDIKDPFGF